MIFDRFRNYCTHRSCAKWSRCDWALTDKVAAAAAGRAISTMATDRNPNCHRTPEQLAQELDAKKIRPTPYREATLADFWAEQANSRSR